MTAEIIILLIAISFLFGAIIAYTMIEPYVIDVLNDYEDIKNENKVNHLVIEYDDLKDETA